VTLADFIAAHNGKYLDYDGHYGAQCVDLIDFYCRDVLGIPIVWANAIDWYGKDAAFEQWIPNRWGDMSSYPLPGDIVVWHADHIVGTGVNGHIAICVSANGMAFTSFDQNWPPGSPCHLQGHNYQGVTGWGRRAKPPSPMPVPPVDPVGGTGIEGSQNWLVRLLDWLARTLGFKG
jgi:CHAP domain